MAAGGIVREGDAGMAHARCARAVREPRETPIKKSCGSGLERFGNFAVYFAAWIIFFRGVSSGGEGVPKIACTRRSDFEEFRTESTDFGQDRRPRCLHLPGSHPPG